MMISNYMNEQKEIRIKGKVLAVLRPVFENNPSLIWAMNEDEISNVLYNYVNKIFEDIKEDLN